MGRSSKAPRRPASSASPRRAARRSSTSTSTGCSTSSRSTGGRRCTVWRNVGAGDAPAPGADGPLGRAPADAARRRTRTRSGRGSRSGPATGPCRREVTVGGGHAGGQLGWIHFGLGPRGCRRGPRHLAGRRGRAVACPVPADEYVDVDRGATAAVPWQPVREGARDDDDADAHGPPGRRRPARLRDARRRAASSRPRCYAARLERLRERDGRRAATTDSSSTPIASTAPNLVCLTGFDPRFEEAILVVGPDGDPAILVGNECFGMAGAAPLPMRRVLFQDLSLPGQPRDRSRPLAEILADEGIGAGTRVGVVGWKTYARPDHAWRRRHSSSTSCGRWPARPVSVENATDLLIDAGDGLRVDQRGRAAGRARVAGLPDLVRRAAAPDRAAAGPDRARGGPPLSSWNGWPLSCHLMLTAGPRATLGLLSPGDRPIERGDRFTVAFGIWGALNCRAGFLVEDAAELPDGIARLRRPAGRAVLRGDRGVVRGACASGRPAARSRRSSIATSATRSSASS